MQNSTDKDIAKRIEAVRGGLSHLKTLTSHRRLVEDEEVRFNSDPFVEDEKRILLSKAYRRLVRKTQVTSFPRFPHVRNRATHTSEVVAIGVTISELLGLNTNLVRAIALGHDMGHAPLGHAGEHFIAHVTGKPFTHEVMAVVVAQHIERNGRGLNLTHATLDGMLRHSGQNARAEMSQESWVNRYADKIAYLFSDYNDFLRLEWPVTAGLQSLVESFGSTHRARIDAAMLALSEESVAAGKVQFELSEAAQRFSELRSLMYDIYPKITAQNSEKTLGPIYHFLSRLEFVDPVLALALMTDDCVLYLEKQPTLDMYHFNQIGLKEILACTHNRTIDYCDPDLDW